ncbi:MAG: trigger factor [Nitrosomonas sp.]|nr:trigger factor [Nitrosomonas sp.]
MSTQVETTNPLERSFELSIPRKKIETEVDGRLKRLAPKIKLQGFRPGKVPLKIVAQQHGMQLHQEVLSDLLQKEFSAIITKEKFNIAGQPHFAAKNQENDGDNYTFSVTFEIYPDVELVDISGTEIKKPVLVIGDAEIQKTLEILRKQQASFEPADRSAQTGDQVNIDYNGQLDGKDFAGGQASGYSLLLGEGRLLKDFEAAIIGMRAGEEKSFDLVFPEDYPGKEVAGKKVVFTVKLNQVSAATLPEIDGEFARSLGVADGDLGKMKEEIKANLEREVLQRTRAKLKEQIMRALLDKTDLAVPQALIQREIDSLIEEFRKGRAENGLRNQHDADIPRAIFAEKAERRVKLGLIVAKLIDTHKLSVGPEQVRQYIEMLAQNYENPEQVVNWHYASPDRVKSFEPVVLEDNVVSWALGQVNVIEETVAFDEFMERI